MREGDQEASVRLLAGELKRWVAEVVGQHVLACMRGRGAVVGGDGDAGTTPSKWAEAILLVCSWENRQVKKSGYSVRHASGLSDGSHGDGASGHGPLCAGCLSSGVSMAREKV